MSMVLEKLAQAEAAKREAAEKLYRNVVRRLADNDDDPELSEVQRALSAVNKTSDDLMRDVGRFKFKNEKRELVRAGAAALEERAQVLKQVEKINRELEAAKQTHAQKMHPLRYRLSELDRAIMDASNAKSELIRTCSEPDLLEESQSLARELRQVGDRLSVADELRWKAQDELKQADHKDRAVAQEKLAAAERKVAELQAEQERILQEDRDVRERMIEV